MDLTFKNPRVRKTASLIHALSRDLRRIESGVGPSVEDLALAPRIEDWSLTYELGLALTGTVLGHPMLADGPVLTSSLYFMDPTAGYARTRSRYYVLGRRRS